jgi:hypothetical protein
MLAACGSSGDDGGPIPDSGPCVADLTPPGGACPAMCTSCDSGVCRIECGAAACNDRTISCPDGFACELVCTGVDACDTTTVQCPAAYPCTVACTAYDACGDMVLRCGSGTCGITCNGPTESCGGAAVDCGTGGACAATCSGTTGPAVDCRGACSCASC